MPGSGATYGRQCVELLMVNYRDCWCCGGSLAQLVCAILLIMPCPMGLFPRLYVNTGNETQAHLISESHYWGEPERARPTLVDKAEKLFNYWGERKRAPH